jgi:DNA-binding CsgD family transcriptional regulator
MQVTWVPVMPFIDASLVEKSHAYTFPHSRSGLDGEDCVGELSAADYRNGLQLLQQLSEAALEDGAFARRGVELLSRLVPSEVTTPSVCHLASGRREVVGTPERAIGAEDRACFDRHFNVHPLVRYHAVARGPDTHRISDSMPFVRFRETALYNEYYRRVGLDHAVALPLWVDDELLVSFVLNRRKRDFSNHDRDLLEILRGGLAALFRQALALQRAREGSSQLDRMLGSSVPVAPQARWKLTGRERDVMRWLAAGKTDRDIGEILGISVRTVHKHLQNIYAKLGVETRTAAAMRVLQAREAL